MSGYTSKIIKHSENVLKFFIDVNNNANTFLQENNKNKNHRENSASASKRLENATSSSTESCELRKLYHDIFYTIQQQQFY